MATAAHHVRHPSHHSRKPLPAHARPSKPAPLSKRPHSHGSKGSIKIAHHKEAESEDDEDSMAVSFLNYCTVCEKQIIVPSNSVLYCSESCRKKDTEKSLTYSYEHYSPPTTPFANLSFEDFTFRDIVPQRSPTQPESKRSSCAFSDISSDDNPTSSDEKSQYSDSDASRYLRSFQSSIAHGADTVRASRPRYTRASTSQVSFSAAPSLSHTPASSASFSLPYTPAYVPSTSRPLPPRVKPHSSSYGSKSIDLVTPLTAKSSPKQYSHKTPPISRTSTSTIEGEIVYAKSPVPSLSAANGSLSRLMAATPH
ncbi:Nn.00g041050.m01.CDS01 [Neocucurbitaria sp. VM-36]